ncbi:Myb/SANT-like DNA-binding domain-containing protein 3 [Pseudolycoriella hygida]|uniref:Regulatory protein zeste n=1 Tax=Pseudolycoriella hygida TaxID=35572 RepID=A0A9Q0MQI8_9DIPT|nr:Myb/SANT-like DNA-binding domain-containing protein 3 [Pseudolycoriella hygida]
MDKKVCFLDFERENLVNLVEKYRDIVENKKTSSNIIAQKKQIWERITLEYNQNPNVKKRLTKQLRKLWENTKAKRKNKLKSSSTYSLLSTTIDKHINFSGNTTLDTAVDGDDLQDTTDDMHCDANEQPTAKAKSNHLGCSEGSLDELLTPVISLRVKKIEDATHQQREIHLLSTQREQLQIKALEERLSQQSELHAIKMEQEREFHQLRMSQEKDLYLQRVRWEQELHQLRVLDYNKVQSSSYSVMYKQ